MSKRKSTKKVMRLRPELFWDVDPKTIDPKKHAQYIIERVLDFGSDAEVRWVWRHYPKGLIFTTVAKSKGMFPATKSLWQELARVN